VSTSVISVPRRLQREQAASPNFLSEITVELSAVFLRLYSVMSLWHVFLKWLFHLAVNVLVYCISLRM
jgi:hypothetical protein